MPDRNLGTISIGIGVNLQSLEAGLRRAYQDVESWKQPQKTVHIGVQLGFKNTWRADQIKAAVHHRGELQQKLDAKPVVFKARFKPIGARDIYTETQKALNAVDKAGNYKIKPLTLRFTADTKTAAAVYSELQAYFEKHHLKVHIDYEGGPAPAPGGPAPGGRGGRRRPSAGPDTGPDTGPSGSATREPRRPRGGGGGAATGAPGPTSQPREGTPRYPYPCPYCASSFGVKGHLDKHVAQKHPGATIAGEPATATQAGASKARGRRKAPVATATPPPEPTAAAEPAAEPEPVAGKPARAREARFDKLANYVGKGKSKRTQLGGEPRDRFSMPDIGPERTEANKRIALWNAINYLENEEWGETAYTDREGKPLGPKRAQRIIGHDTGGKTPVPIFADVGDKTIKERFAKGEEVFTEEAEKIERIQKAAAARKGALTDDEIQELSDVLGKRDEKGRTILGSGLRGKLLELKIRKPGSFFRSLGVNKSPSDASARVLAQVATGKGLSSSIRNLLLDDAKIREQREKRVLKAQEKEAAAAAGPVKIISEADRARITAKGIEALTRDEKIAYGRMHGITGDSEELLHRLFYSVHPWSKAKKPPAGWFRQLGGKVRPLPVFGRGLTVTPGLTKFGEPGDMFRSERGLPYQLRDIPVRDITAWHETKPELVEEYAAKAQAGSPLPPVIVGPEKRLQDGHHRLAAAQKLGAKSILGYEFAGTAEQAAQFPAPEKWKKARRLDRYYASERDPEGIDFPSFMRKGGNVKRWWPRAKGRPVHYEIVGTGTANYQNALPRSEFYKQMRPRIDIVGDPRPAWGSPAPRPNQLGGAIEHAMGGKYIDSGVFIGLAEKGKPGTHLEAAKLPSGLGRNQWFHAVAFRDKAGDPVGKLELIGKYSKTKKGLSGDRTLNDIFPFVKPYARSRGIGYDMYKHAQKLGFDVEGISDANAIDFGHGQTELGHGFWRSRKRKQGWTDAEIALHEIQPNEYQLGGNLQMIGTRGQGLWQAPGPGWIVPHHLIDKVPHAQLGKAHKVGLSASLAKGHTLKWSSLAEKTLPEIGFEDPGYPVYTEFAEGTGLIPGLHQAKAIGLGGMCGVCGAKFATDAGFKSHQAQVKAAGSHSKAGFHYFKKHKKQAPTFEELGEKSEKIFESQFEPLAEPGYAHKAPHKKSKYKSPAYMQPDYLGYQARRWLPYRADLPEYLRDVEPLSIAPAERMDLSAILRSNPEMLREVPGLAITPGKIAARPEATNFYLGPTPGGTPVWPWSGSGHDVRGMLKNEVVSNLADDLRRRGLTLPSRPSYYTPDFPGDETYQAVNQTIHSWAESAGSPEGLQSQLAAANLFDMPESVFRTLRKVYSNVFGDIAKPAWWDPGRHTMTWPEFLKSAESPTGAFYTDLVHRMYDVTQARLSSAGITSLPLYRGMSLDRANRDVIGTNRPLQLQPMSSWASSIGEAHSFMHAGEGSQAAMLFGNVPARRILATPHTGFGALNETEFIVLGGEGDIVNALEPGQRLEDLIDQEQQFWAPRHARVPFESWRQNTPNWREVLAEREKASTVPTSHLMGIKFTDLSQEDEFGENPFLYDPDKIEKHKAKLKHYYATGELAPSQKKQTHQLFPQATTQLFSSMPTMAQAASPLVAAPLAASAPKSGWGPLGKLIGMLKHGLGMMGGGPIEGSVGRAWHFVLDGKKGTVHGNEAQVAQWVRTMTAQGHTIKPATGTAPEGPGSIPSHSPHIRKRAGGGSAPKGMYVVGEAGPELFVPESMGWIIPHDVMSQLPKRAEGGAVEHAAGGAVVDFPTKQGGYPMTGFAGMASRADIMTKGAVIQGGVQRVYVMNWPSSMAHIGSGGSGGGTTFGFAGAAGPTLSTNQKVFINQMAKQLATAVGAAGRSARSGGGGTVSPRAARGGLLSAREQEENLVAIRQEQYEALKKQKIVQQRVEAGVAEAAARSVGPATGQAFATIAGRGGIKAREAVFRVATNEFQQQLKRVAELRGGITAATASLAKATTPADIRRFTKELSDLNERLPVAQDRATELGDEVESLGKGVTTTSDKLKVWGANLYGITVGMAAFSIGMQGTQLAMEGISKAAAPAIDTMMGFRATSERVTSQLGKQLVETKGNIEATFGLTGQMAGLSKAATDYAQIQLGGPTVAKAAGQIEGQASDIFRGMAGVEQTKGMFGGYGGFLGGPFLAELMGGGKGFTEQIAGNIVELTKAGTPMSAGERAAQVAQLNPADPNYFKKLEEMTKEGPTQLQAQAQDSLKAYIDDLNEAAKRGAKSLGQAAEQFQLIKVDATDMRKELYKAAGAAAGDATYAQQIADANYIMVDSFGQVVQDQNTYKQGWSQLAKGRTMTDISTYAKQLTQSMKVARDAAREQALYEQQVAGPFQFGMQRFASGQAYMAPQTGTNVFMTSGPTKNEINASITNITGLRKAINQFSSNAIAREKDFVQTWSGQGAEFETYSNAVKDYGKQIAGIQTRIFKAEIGLNNANYANTMRLARRAYSDALGLAGRATGASNLGAVQRQQTMLGFGLQQREITTQLAVAQFAVQGQTGEERFYAQKEAITRAQIAQKQLDLQRKGFNIEATRGVTDTQRQLALTQKQWDTSNLLMTKQKELAETEAASNAAMMALNGTVKEADTNYQAFMGAAAQAASEFGISLADAKKELMKTWGAPTTTPAAPGAAGNDARHGGAVTNPTPRTPVVSLQVPEHTLFSTPDAGMSSAKPLYATIVALPRTNPYVTDTGQSGPRGKNAMGLLTNVTGPTELTVGEAGPETVAVLRNPRSMAVGAMGGGSGGNSFNIVVNYAGTGTGDDAHAMAVLIAAEVEKELNRKGQLMGLRGAAY